MSGIQAVSGAGPLDSHRGVFCAVGADEAKGVRGAAGGEEKSEFGSTLNDVLNGVDKHQQLSAKAVEDLVAGRRQDVLSVVAEVADADMSFKLLIGVRNKIIEAYKQTMNMQI